MDVEVSVTDNSDEIKQAAYSAMEVALEAVGLQAEGYAKMLCPFDTGRLRNSITHTADKDTAYIGTNVEYAAYVEYGHSLPSGGQVPPKPYLQPAAEDHAEEYKQIFKQYMKNA